MQIHFTMLFETKSSRNLWSIWIALARDYLNSRLEQGEGPLDKIGTTQTCVAIFLELQIMPYNLISLNSDTKVGF